MRPVKIALWTLLLLPVLIGLAVLATLALLKSVPGDYQPMSLSPSDQETVMRQFVKHTVEDFLNPAGAGGDFQWTLTEEQANAYLASMDAIASQAPRPVQPSKALAELNLSDPMIKIRQGRLTLMIFSTRYNRLLNVDFSPQVDAKGSFRLRVVTVRVGRMPLPRILWQDRLEEVRRRLLQQLSGAQADTSQRSEQPIGRLAELLGGMVGAMNGQEVPARISLSRRQVEVRSIEMVTGLLTVHCRAVPQ